MLGTSYFLRAISSVYPSLSWSTTGLHNFQKLLLALLVKCGQRTLFTEGGNMTPLLAWAWANWALEPGKIFEDPNQADLHPAEFPGQSVSPA